MKGLVLMTYQVDHLFQHHVLNGRSYFIFNTGKKHYSKLYCFIHRFDVVQFDLERKSLILIRLRGCAS